MEVIYPYNLSYNLFSDFVENDSELKELNIGSSDDLSNSDLLSSITISGCDKDLEKVNKHESWNPKTF